MLMSRSSRQFSTARLCDSRKFPLFLELNFFEDKSEKKDTKVLQQLHALQLLRLLHVLQLVSKAPQAAKCLNEHILTLDAYMASSHELYAGKSEFFEGSDTWGTF